MLNKSAYSAEPNRALVECAIAEALQIAQRQGGLALADFVRLLDSGLPISDLLAAINVLRKPSPDSIQRLS
jgi:hypothetical protein